MDEAERDFLRNVDEESPPPDQEQSSNQELWYHRCKLYTIGGLIFLVMAGIIIVVVVVVVVVVYGKLTSRSGVPASVLAGENRLELEDFYGLEDAYSVNTGKIELRWDNRPLLDTFEGISFDVFVALGDFNYTAQFLDAKLTVDELVTIFDREPTYQHLEVSGTNKLTVTTPYLGEVQTILVTARLNDITVSNLRFKQVIVSKVDPSVRDDINVVGLFLPTQRVTIRVENPTLGSHSDHFVWFEGPVATEARNLEVGDIVTGLTSDLEPFVRRILKIVENQPDVVIMSVDVPSLNDIFIALEVDGIFAITNRGSETRQLRRRRLFWGAVTDWVSGAVETIGDAIVSGVEAAVELVMTGAFEFEETNSIIDINEIWEEELTHELTGATLKLAAFHYAEMSLGAKLRVEIFNSEPKLAGTVFVKAEIGVGASLVVSASQEATYEDSFDIWETAWSETVFVGPVPIELYAKPSVKADVTAKATLSVEMEASASVRAGTYLALYYDTSREPSYGQENNPPEFTSEYKLPSVEGEATLVAGMGVTIQVEFGVYQGFISGTVGFRGGMDLNLELGVASLPDEPLMPTVEDFTFQFGLSIPLQADFLYGAFELPAISIWEKKWPIIGLPQPTLTIFDEYRCLKGDSDATTYFSLKADPSYPEDAILGNPVLSDRIKWYIDLQDDWSSNPTAFEAKFTRTAMSSSPYPRGTVTIVLQPEFPPFLKVVRSFDIESLFSGDSVECVEPAACDGAPFFNKLNNMVGATFNSDLFLSQPPDPTADLVPSTVYKFQDFMAALTKIQGAGEEFAFWLGDDCTVDAQKGALANIAAFLGQAMRETIIYDACDENNWDKWRADIFKEPTSPVENLSSLYPMSSGCGQLGQKYADYSCEDECGLDLEMQITATTNAKWIGAPPPLFCGPKSMYDGLGYWNPQQLCNGSDQSCAGQPFFYEGQTAGVHVSIAEDSRFPEFFFTNPLPDADGSIPNPRSPENFPTTNVEGCCWWGRGVIQTTGRCNFGKLNKRIGAGAGASALFPDIDFCTNPQKVCDGPADLKWISGIFFWVSGPQAYNRDGYSFLDGAREFVARGCAETDTDPTRTDCDFVFEHASGIVNRGCHNPGAGGCPDCIPGATCGPAHNVPERVAASKQALRVLLGVINPTAASTDVPVEAQTKNSCGSSFADAGKCAQQCPSGVNSECPASETCFAQVVCA